MSDEIMRSLGRIEGELLEIRKVGEHVSKLASRVSRLERANAKLYGALAMVGLAWSAIVAYVMKGVVGHATGQ